MKTLSAFTSLALAAAVGAQCPSPTAASITSYGTGCYGNPMTLTASPVPLLGTTVNLTTSNEPGLNLGLNYLSLVQNPGLDLGILGAPGCNLYVGTLDVGNLISNLGLPGIGMTVSLPIPSSLGLIGAQVYSQSVWFDPGANPFGLVTSNGICMTLGSTMPCPTVAAVSSSNPAAGSVVTITGTNFSTDPAGICCSLGPVLTVNATGTQMTVLVANRPGVSNLALGNYLPGDYNALGAGGIAPYLPPGVTVPPNAQGSVGVIKDANIVTFPIPLAVTTTAGSTQLPVSIDGLGRICIDFSGTSWTGSEDVEVELHFNITPAPTNGKQHCDFFHTDYTNPPGPGSAAYCASLCALFCVQNLALQCPGISFLLSGTQLYLVAPPGHTFVNLASSHISYQ